MKRKPISLGRSRRLFHLGDKTSRVNISAAPMRGGIRL